LKDLQQKQIWESIMKKYKTMDNEQFLNSLTEDEFTEYIKERSFDDF
jgi:hypothetical protein